MAFLEKFSEDEKTLLVSLPYRAGLWLGSVDDSGGPTADFKELTELEKIVDEKSRGMFESAFVHEVMVETNGRQDQWREWAKSIDTTLDDCTKAVALIDGKLSGKDIDAYRANIMAIGLSVAKAFREFDDGASLPVKLMLQIRLFWEGCLRILSRGKSREHDHDIKSIYNISYEEDVALAKLSKALHPGLDDGEEDAQISES